MAAYENGCRRFDGALKGFGGCPMAKDDLVGNMATENMVYWFKENEISIDIQAEEFVKSMGMANQVFPIH